MYSPLRLGGVIFETLRRVQRGVVGPACIDVLDLQPVVKEDAWPQVQRVFKGASAANIIYPNIILLNPARSQSK